VVEAVREQKGEKMSGFLSVVQRAGLIVLLGVFSANAVTATDEVTVAGGKLQGTTNEGHNRAHVQGNSLCRGAGWSTALEGTATRAGVGRRAASG
jgi:hypothetical protein